MGRHSSFTRKHLWPLFLSCTFLSLLLIVSACARIPNTIPHGYGSIFKDPARSSTAARVDYPIVHMVDPNDKSVKVLVTKNGERFWVWEHDYWDRKLWKPITWYQIGMIAHGVPDAICYTKPINPGTEDMKEIPCEFTSGTANDYLSKPLFGTLNYWVGGDENIPPGENDQASGGVERLYYLIPKQ